MLALAASFVAKAPDHDRRVVAVALHQGAHVGHVLRLVGEEACAEGRGAGSEVWGRAPSCALRCVRVSRETRTVLVHDGDAHAVVDLEQAAVGRVVTRAPPDRGLLEIYDRVGITVMDENRTRLT